jgi:plastocyanin
MVGLLITFDGSYGLLRMTASRVAWTILVPFCVVLAVLAVVVIVRENSTSADATPGEASTVVMEKIAYSPLTLTVGKGDEVLFDNSDVAPHTVTADDGSSDSGVIDPGKSYRLTVNEPLSYHCTIHPAMKAKIELEG